MKETTPFFSIIVPVYQAELHLKKCVDGILSQQFDDWELILVNDGSMDNSLSICYDYQMLDSRITVINNSNHGAAYSRNIGTKKANGLYILYLDSDDYWEGEDALTNLRKRIIETGCDICLFGCWDEYFDTGRRVMSRGRYNSSVFENGSKSEILKSLVVDNQFPGSCWIMSVNRIFLIENDIQFIAGHKAEDIDWIIQVIRAAEKITYLNEAFYIYKKHQKTSVTGKAGLNSLIDVLSTVEKWSKIIKQEKSEPYYAAINTYIVYVFFTTFKIYNSLSDDEKKKAGLTYSNIKLNYNRIIGIRTNGMALLYKVFGYRFVSFLIKILK